ncbi:4-hydroxy-2-oxovalerate aldolase [Desulfovibrio sp. JC022]|uniref:4-hydroxy-2-oxovalerate aldolase n=1 Tax=Desulfovibrio sp. JC022 TaxID=2593642 RepID=UPI0013CF527B|nr:4-hydroxy-2-oxovalerate aldolase [Desulfovibrio sp. JC022]NDV22207.1 4-hydroxy-2-oxovalerate aldolase [Desulfovibrio sp. JC022]
MKTQILDTTLRDGSYAIDFQFTAQDTAVIAKELELAGVDIIEVGHGVGLGASEKGFGKAFETDRDYLAAAGKVLTRAKYGMFCIPGIAELEDIDMAADMGAQFIRIGTNANDISSSEAFIARAKKHGLFVSANFMKSYVLEAEDFAEKAKQTQEYGSDVLCVVDSSGGMLSSELKSYFEAVQSICDIPLGFHGHNNLGLAVAHSVQAVEMGAAIVDTSLQGMGRSAGNAATELVVAALDRMGIETGVDMLRVMDVGEKYVKPLIRGNGLSSLDMVTGFAQFHSSYMSTIRKYASKYNIDPRILIIELCKVDKVDAPEDLVESIASGISEKTTPPLTSRFDFTAYHGNEQS